MTHMREYAESEGNLSPAEDSDRDCVKCGEKTVIVQTWDSSDGAYEDYKFTCKTCKHVWWVDGIDS